jgi:hypothetical protein
MVTEHIASRPGLRRRGSFPDPIRRAAVTETLTPFLERSAKRLVSAAARIGLRPGFTVSIIVRSCAVELVRARRRRTLLARGARPIRGDSLWLARGFRDVRADRFCVPAGGRILPPSAATSSDRRPHLIITEMSPCRMLIVSPTTQSQIVDCRLAAQRPRLNVIELQKLPRAAAKAVLGRKGTTTVIALVDRAPHSS